MTAHSLQVLNERLGLAFSTVLLAVMPICAVLLLAELI
jgi:hypothetical protein